MADKQLRFLLTAQDNASQKIAAVGKTGEATGNKISSAFTGLGSKIGGELGEVLSTVGEGMDKLGEHTESTGKKMIAGGAAAAGLGVALQTMGSKDKAAAQQLDAAIEATGNSVEAFKPQIEETVHQMENYGHSAVDTMGALQTLTTATKDPEKAIAEMGVTADLAAAKHESLGSAAAQVARILGGSGGKTLSQYGITMGHTGDKTKDAQAALDALAGKLSGQASAASDTFSGKLLALKTKMTDDVAILGQKFGPAITAIGTTSMAAGALLDTGLIQKTAGAVKGLMGIGSAADKMAASTVASTALAGAAVEGEEAATVAAAESMSAAVPIVGALGIAAGVLGAAFLSSRAKQEQARQTMESYTEAVKADGGVVGDQTKQLLLQKLATSGVYDAYAKYGISMSTVTQAALGNTDAQKKLYAATTDTNVVTGAGGRAALAAGKASTTVTHALGAQYTQVVDTANGFKLLVHYNKEVASGSQDLKPKVLTLTQAIVAQGLSTDAATRKMQQANDAAGLLAAGLDKLNGAALGAEESEIAFKNSVANVTTAAKSNGTSLDINTQKGRDNTSAVLDAIKAANDHAQAVAKRTGSMAKGTSALNTDISALRTAAAKAGLNKTAIDNLIRSYEKVPANVKTQAQLTGIADAEAKLAALTAQRYVNIKISGPGASIARQNAGINAGMGRATGDEYTKAGTFLVGEDGPERVTLPQGSKVTQNNRLPKGNTGSGGDTYNVVVNVAGSIRTDRELLTFIEQGIATRQRRRGTVSILGG